MDRYALESFLLKTVDFEAVAVEVRRDMDRDDLRAQVAYARSIDIDTDDLDLKDEETLEDFNEFVAEYSATMVDEAVESLVWGLEIGQEGIRVWRSIMVGADWLEGSVHERPLGVCWSFEEDVAECHWGDFSDDKREIRIEALVDPSDVDWPDTLRLNATLDEEKEIRIKADAFVNVVSAVWVAPRHAGDLETTEAVIEAGRYPAGDAAFQAVASRTLAA